MGIDLSSILSNQKNKVSILSVAAPGVPPSVLMEFDACVNEHHTSEMSPTEFEVETGEIISDHIITKPRSLKIHAIITDTPISVLMGLLTTGVAYAAPSTAELGKYAPATVLAPALLQSLLPAARSSVTKFGLLIDLQRQKLPVQVVTSLNVYNNMWIKKISVPRDAKTGRMVLVEIDFVQLLLVKPQTVNLTALKNADLAADTKDGGNKGGLTNDLLKKEEAARTATFNAIKAAGGG